MFDDLKKRVKNWMQKATAGLGLSKEFKDIFQTYGVPSFSQFYYNGIFVWKWLYKGYYKNWHLVKAPTITEPARTRKMFRMDVPKAISAEMAGLIWSEQCEIHISQGEGTDQPLDEFVQEVLKQNNFWGKMQEHIEQSLALGGGALKVWYEEKHDEEGNAILGSGKIRIGYCMADQFIPTAWDNSKVSEGVFISRQAKNGYYYTRLEWHKWNGSTYCVSNELYKMDPNKGEIYTNETQDILGFKCPLSEIYPYLSPVTTVKNISESLFYYYRTAIANNLDDNSPLGVSIYSNALDTLHALDICYDSFIREFQLGKKRILVPSSCISTVVDPVSGQMCRYFDASNEAYEVLSTDDPEKLRVQDNTIALRVDEHVAAINAFLSVLCLQTGFSTGTFTFDQAQGLKTATEIISENSKTYKTIKSHQSQIKIAIEGVVKGIVQIAALYDLEWKGHKIAALANQDLEINVVFDDSILQDRQTNINEGITLVTNELMSKQTFLEKILGMTEEEAALELKKISSGKSLTADMFDQMEQSQMEGSNPNITENNEIVAEAEEKAGKTLNGAQTQSLISVIAQYQNGDITIGQAVNIIAIAIGVTKQEAKALIEGSE